MKPAFYAIIPAHVRYSDISSSAKLLYGEITALCQKEGFCYASNSYFSKLYDTQPRTIQRWLVELQNIKSITTEIGEGKRRIYIQEGVTKMSYPHDKNVVPPHDKNVTHNNTSINNTINNDFNNFYKSYPVKKSKEAAKKKYLYLIKKKEATHKEIMQGLERYKQDIERNKTDKAFIKHPSTWLNQGCWEDEYDVPLEETTTKEKEEAMKILKADLQKAGYDV